MITKPDTASSRVKLSLSTECHHEVVDRAGWLAPCGRMAIAIRLDFNQSSTGGPYPVCARHVSKLQDHMVPLIEIMGAKP